MISEQIYIIVLTGLLELVEKHGVDEMARS